MTDPAGVLADSPMLEQQRSRRAARAALAKRSWPIVLVTAWLVLLGFGFQQVFSYSGTPGAEPPHPEMWPTDSHLVRASAHPTLMMFVHPMCPCTRASLTELNVLLNEVPGQIDPLVVFLRPGAADADWDQSGSWASALRLPGVRLMTDADGREARVFGAATSGQVLLYDVEGRLRFAGGITDSRGHEGDNLGLREVLAIIRGQDRPGALANPVYGCPLADPPEGRER